MKSLLPCFFFSLFLLSTQVHPIVITFPDENILNEKLNNHGLLHFNEYTEIAHNLANKKMNCEEIKCSFNEYMETYQSYCKNLDPLAFAVIKSCLIQALLEDYPEMLKNFTSKTIS